MGGLRGPEGVASGTLSLTQGQPSIEQILEEARENERRQPFKSLLHSLLPFLIIIAVYVFLGLIGKAGTFTVFGLTALPIGKFIILSGAHPGIDMSPWQLAIMVFLMDTWVGYVLSYNLHHVYRIPRVGPWLHNVQSYCRYWLHEYPWMRRWAITGVVLFVTFPLSGTGAPGGALLGRIVGLRPRVTLLAIMAGSAIGCGVMAAFAVPLGELFLDIKGEWWFHALSVGLIATLLIGLYVLGARVSRAAARFAHSDSPEGATGGES